VRLSDWARAALSCLAWAGILALILGVNAGTLSETHLLGTHDWDQMYAHRYLVSKTIREYGQFPFWNPYSCGGHTAWGGLESAVTVVSPWLPAHLLFSLPLATRIEIVGTALLSAIGTWLFAGRFTKSPGARALACAMFVVNGRWAFQTAVGHTWHLYYAWTPWALYFFDRACKESGGRARHTALAGASIAMMVYTGAIYPLPQSAFLLCLYALLLAVASRSWRPVLALGITGLTAFGLAAPKLLPILDMLRLYPRHVESNETITLAAFVQAFTAPGQTAGSRPADVSQWGWHEYGIYIGGPAFLAMFIGLIGARSARENALKWCGVACLLLGFGAFHAYAPWALLRELPLFKSQHVPVRWQYPATLICGVLAGATLERFLRRRRARTVLEIALLGAVFWIGYDIVRNASLPLRGAFTRSMPQVLPSTEFHQFDKVPAQLHYRDSDWTPPGLPAMLANVGTIECSTFPGLHPYYRDQAGRAPGLGARGEGHPEYRGETYVLSGEGRARIVRFTPNEIAVQLASARIGDLAILNQNWEAGWSINGQSALNHADALAAPIRHPNQLLVFRYRPRSWWLALMIFTLTAFAVSFPAWKARIARLHQPARTNARNGR
jgi:hypothetical protein